MTGSPISRIAVAQASADLARARLAMTVGELQRRASPSSIAHDVTETIKQRGTTITLDAVAGVRQRPATVAVVAASAIGLWLAHAPIARFARRATSATPDSLPPHPPKHKRGPAI